MSAIEATETVKAEKTTEDYVAELTAKLNAERSRELKKNEAAAERRKVKELKAVESYYSNLSKTVAEDLGSLKWKEKKINFLLKNQKAWAWIPLFKDTPELLKDEIPSLHRRREELLRPLSKQANFYHPNSRHIGFIVERYPEECASILDRYERNS